MTTSKPRFANSIGFPTLKVTVEFRTDLVYQIVVRLMYLLKIVPKEVEANMIQ